MASTYLSKTFGSDGNLTTWTFSGWFKRTSPDNTTILGCAINGENQDLIYFQSDGTLRWWNLESNAYVGQLKTTRVFRDPSAWYHIVFVWDSSNATADNRMRIYVNGNQETVFTTRLNPPLNSTSLFNTADSLAIGRAEADIGSYPYFDGSMAHVHFIDGTAYDASAFGETDATTGIWKPKTAPSVTYGTNGFFLKFENSAAFGTDSSGNANNFTVNGTMTQTIDTPSNVFATLNPLDNYYQGSTFSNGNNTIATTSGNIIYNTSTLGFSSGKYYMENKVNTSSGSVLGVVRGFATANDNGNKLGNRSDGWGYDYRGLVENNGADVGGTFATYGAGDIMGIALDLDNNRLFFSKNGTWQNSADPTTSTGALTVTAGTYFFAIGDNNASVSISHNTNFGNGFFGTTAVSSAQNPDDGIGIFEYDVPTGYYALNTKAINAQEYD
jgi:hypothetical protein